MHAAKTGMRCFRTKKQEQREEKVEMLLDGEAPEVPGEEVCRLLLCARRYVYQVSIQEECAEPVFRVLVYDSGEDENCDYGKVNDLSWLDAKDTTDIEALQVKRADRSLVFEDAPADQDAADREEQGDAGIAEALEGCIGVAANFPGRVMSHEDAEDGNSTPAIQAWQIARLGAELTSTRGDGPSLGGGML